MDICKLFINKTKKLFLNEYRKGSILSDQISQLGHRKRLL
jgi:hypothetical protein